MDLYGGYVVNIEKIYNQDAEGSILSSILVKNDSICEVIDVLNPEDFYNTRHKIIYKKLKEMYENSLPMDIITLSEKLGEKLKEVGGVSYLSELVNSNLTVANVKNYGEIVKEKSNYRQLKSILSSSIDKLNNGEVAAEDLINHVQDSLFPNDIDISVTTLREDDIKGIAPTPLYKKYGFEEHGFVIEFEYFHQKLISHRK